MICEQHTPLCFSVLMIDASTSSTGRRVIDYSSLPLPTPYAHQQRRQNRLEMVSEERHTRRRTLPLITAQHPHDLDDDVGEALHVLHQLHNHRRHVVVAHALE